jgi:hypothetical protein
MQIVEQLPSLEVSQRRSRRSRRSRVSRNLRNNWRRSRLRRTVLSVILVVGAVIGGYKASMYVVNQDLPSVDDLNSPARPK